ncbi:hypothetical protein SELMODRAFT_158348 [Selaginella moellendorffii]|uniref:Importin N-terminal domain-containing protein n=1 Tax=Selaginella moellendorffii TaxID=88036 RepID=D8SUA8_SELML|nr:hypothetical protein SELMODRAFT_158348 [Selaginella moellendorffii]
MDVQSLVAVLQLALSRNLDERKAGEERLKQCELAEGHLVRLLQIIVSTNLELSVRQIASIYFKNVLSREWSPRDGHLPKLSETDRNTIRNNILEALIHVPSLLRVQLAECLKTMVHCDFPDRWPSLVPGIDSNLKSQDQQRINGALHALRILTRKYEFKEDSDRMPINAIFDTMFPVLLEILKYLISLPNPPIEVADLIKLICKIFWSSTYLDIPPILCNLNTCTGWMTCFLNLVERPVPSEGQPADLEMRKSWGWWKVKKWTLHIVNRLYNRFGDPKSSKCSDFSEMFQTHFADKFLQSYMNLLGVYKRGEYLTDRVLNLSLQYLSTCVSKPQTYQQMKPQLDLILFEIIFPLMCFNSIDEQLWRDDPHEYVRKGYDIIEDLYSPRTAAQNFILELFRRRKEHLQKFLQFVVEVFNRYDAAPANQKPYRQKDGALLAVGSLSDRLKQISPYKHQLEQMLVQHVYPEFNSPAGHLRAKAAWVSGQYARITFANPANFTTALRSVVCALKDPDLPVRVDSVIALRSFVEASQGNSRSRVVILFFFPEFFKLMNEVENEDLVFTLETIVNKFGEEMAPYALGLCQNLAAAFWKCLQSSETDEDDDDSGALAAMGCLRAIGTILESVSALPHLFPQMEPTLLPIMRKMLTTDGQDVFEEVLEIVSYMTYYSPSISLEMWTLWPLIMEALNEWAVDYFENILVPLDNYISRSTEHFLTCKSPDYQQSLFKALSMVMSDEKLDDSDIIAAPKLIESVLQNCKGRVDEWVEPYLKISLDRYGTTTKNGLKDLLIEVVANALYYNPALCLNVLQKLRLTTSVFQSWFQMLYAVKRSGLPAHFRREHDKKVCVLGLASVLSLPGSALPAELQSGLDQIFRAVLRLLIAYKDQVAENAKETENGDMDGWESGEEDWDKELGDDDDPDEVNNEKLQQLASQAKSFQPRDDDDDSDDDFIDDEEFQAAIDNVDPFIFFADIIKAISACDPARFQALSRSLDFQHQAMAHGVEQYAEVRRKEIEKEMAQNSSLKVVGEWK